MSFTQRWLALDIGGANLKAADGCDFARSIPFALWRNPQELPDALRQLIASTPAADHLAVTMTGELADCFETKAAGVRAILTAVERVAGDRDVWVYLSDGRLVPLNVAFETPHLAAASNWHALGRFAGRFLGDRPGLLIDVGSTTTDIIALSPLGPTTHSRTDPERLAAGELVYTGVERSPVCAVVRQLPWRGAPCPVAQELFATALDAYLILGLLPEDPADQQTADGRPKSIGAARDRLARMVCADRTMFSADDAQRSAEAIHQAQIHLLRNAARQVVATQPLPPRVIIISGSGEFLARAVVFRLQFDCEVVSLSAEMGETASRCAPARALAVLAAEGRCAP
jgi:probable H4MPT-linked C1 transfer pathway protein